MRRRMVMARWTLCKYGGDTNRLVVLKLEKVSFYMQACGVFRNV